LSRQDFPKRALPAGVEVGRTIFKATKQDYIEILGDITERREGAERTFQSESRRENEL
jgi:hypothetical protein